MAPTPSDEHAQFIQDWNSLLSSERRQIRRLVRIGRPVETKDEAVLAVGFADYQRSRAWWRYYWLWFIPAVLIALVAAIQIHPILIGIVLGGMASTFMVRRNFNRVRIINEELLGS